MALKKQGNLPDIEKQAKLTARILPVKVANLAKNHYLKGFKQGGKQTDNSMSGWAERKRKDKKNNRKRAILVKTGSMRNDLDIRRTTKDEIVLGTNDTDYASYHNEGTKNLPQREFLGDSKELETKIRKLVINELDKGLK